jgi:protein-disulfide isomerase
MSSFSSPGLAIAVGTRDHIRGALDAPVTLVEYGDYECPYCASIHVVIAELLRRSENGVRFVFRHFPVNDLHRHAYSAAEIAEAAAQQQRFWEMHDALFAHHAALEERHLIDYAVAVGLDLPPVRLALTTHSHAGHVREDFVSGVHSGVNGTPALFINDLRYDGPIDINSLWSAIVEAGAARGYRLASWETFDTPPKKPMHWSHR